MKWSVVPLGLTLAFGMAGAAQAAKSVSIDFTGDTVVAQGLNQVNSSAGSDGVTTIEQRGGKNVARTGGTDAARNLYLQIDPVFKADLKSVWVTVEYWDEGTGGLKLEFDGEDDPYTATRPDPRTKFDARRFTSQTWHLTGFKLQGGQQGGADLRINDVDDPEFIARVTVSDTDPQEAQFPYAVNKITIDGNATAEEWDGAYPVTLDRPELDGVAGSPNWRGPENFSGKYWFKYDESALYVRGEVRDTTPRLNTVDDGVNYWNGDGMELFIGLDESDLERTSYAETDFQVMIGMGKNPGWGIYPSGESLDPIGENLAFGPDQADGYTFELQLPWTKLDPNAQITPGQRIGWYMFANDSTVDPSSQQIALGPAGRTGPSGNPSVWIRSVLLPKP
jgi:hypothetical protein